MLPLPVFVPWSEPLRKQVAEILRPWLQVVLPNIDPWMSTGIDGGQRWFEVLPDKAKACKAAIAAVIRSSCCLAVPIQAFLFLLAWPARADSWPPGAAAGGSYVVHPSEAIADFDEISLPDGFTLKFESSVGQIQWRVGSLSFGKKVTIDLTAPPPPATLTGAAAKPKGGQASWGKQGLAGDQGGGGFPGLPGRALFLKVRTLKSPKTGSLWIKTDGAQGTPGGAGGAGQLGGGSTCGGGSEGPRSHGGSGGVGGTGGAGGWGGMSSFVLVQIGSFSPGYEIRPNACTKACEKYDPPPGVNANNQTIVIYGVPGCSGSGGAGGAGGPGGDANRELRLCREFPFNNYFMHGGPQGPAGAPGIAGVVGMCGTAVLRGPAAPPPPTPPNATEKDKCEAGNFSACSRYSAKLLSECQRPDPGTPPPPAAIEAWVRCTRSAECYGRIAEVGKALATCSEVDTLADAMRCEAARRDVAMAQMRCKDGATQGGGPTF